MFSNDGLLSYISGSSRVPVIEYCLMRHSMSWFQSRILWRNWDRSYWPYQEGWPCVVCWHCRCTGASLHLLPSILTTKGAGLASSCVYAHTVQWMSLYKTNPSLLAIIYQRASLRQCAPQRCPVLVLTVVLDNHKGVVCIFSQLRSGTRLELTLEYISALKAGSRKLSLSWLRYLFFCMVHS